MVTSSSHFEERVGSMLVAYNFITSQQLTQAQQEARVRSASLLDTLVSLGLVSQETLVTMLSFQLRIPAADIRHAQIDPRAVQLVEAHFARQNMVLPLGFDTEDGSLRVATRAPNDFTLSAVLSGMADRQVKFVLAMGANLAALIDLVYTPGMAAILEKTGRFYVPDFNESLVSPQAGKIPKEDALRHRVLPLHMVDNTLVVVTRRIDPALQAELASRAGCSVELQLAWGGDLDAKLIERAYAVVAQAQASAAVATPAQVAAGGQQEDRVVTFVAGQDFPAE